MMPARPSSAVAARVLAVRALAHDLSGMDRVGSSFMGLALAQARRGALCGEVPIGAVLVNDGAVVYSAHNRTRGMKDPTAHAEMIVIREAARLLSAERLSLSDLYVTLEPCPMCAGAISLARIRRLYFGALDPKGGAVESGVRLYADPTCHHRPEVYGGLGETESADLLRSFFAERRGAEARLEGSRGLR